MFNFKRQIYLDTAAATPLAPEVFRVMKPFGQKYFANPASIHFRGNQVALEIKAARQQIADILKVQAQEITFLSGGTEANNLAIKGVAFGWQRKYGRPGRIIVPAIEHLSILAPIQQLKALGWQIDYLPVSAEGLINPLDLKKLLKSDTVLISLGYVNNEIGVIQPISELAKVIRRFRQENNQTYPYFHSDACQAGRFLTLDCRHLKVDLLSLNGSKIYGPKGIGLLYHQKDIPLEPLLAGGGQELNFRSGTENVPGIIGLAKALNLAQTLKTEENEKLIKLRDQLRAGVLKIPGAQIHGSWDFRVANNLNVSFPGVEAELLVLRLDASGIACSAGSACSTYGLDETHVLLALGVESERAQGAIRFSLGRDTTRQDIDYLLSILPREVELSRGV